MKNLMNEQDVDDKMQLLYKFKNKVGKHVVINKSCHIIILTELFK